MPDAPHIAGDDAAIAELLASVTKIGGWFSEKEIVTLYLFAKNLPDKASILEIGSYRGRSSNAIGHAIKGTGKTLYCLDVWRDFEKQGIRKDDKSAEFLPPTDFAIFEDFLKETEWFSENIRVLRGSTRQFRDFLPPNFFSMIFIDGAHDYENAFRDISAALKCLRKGGLICGHDFISNAPGVIKAVNELIVGPGKFQNFGVIQQTSIWYAA